MAKTKTGQRVSMQLDTRIALEAVLLNRLERLPVSRRQEWLRGLLIQGFRSECQALRDAPDEATVRPAMAFANRKASEPQTPSRRSEPEPIAMQIKSVKAYPANKPFTALGKVIG